MRFALFWCCVVSFVEVLITVVVIWLRVICRFIVFSFIILFSVALRFLVTGLSAVETTISGHLVVTRLIPMKCVTF